MDSEVLPSNWTAHKAPTGHTYYYNSVTKKSTYVRPLPEIGPPAKESGTSEQQVKPQGETNHDQDFKDRSIDQESRREVFYDRPKYRFKIPKAQPWVQVQTKKGYTFYHNIRTLESSWDVPESIAPLVEAWADAKQMEDMHEVSAEVEDESQDSRSQSRDHSMEEEEEEEDELDIHEGSPTQQELAEYGEEDIALQLAAMEDAGETLFGGNADDFGPELTLNQKDSIFREMLAENEVDPFRTWDSQVEKFASDPRYLLFDTTQQRKAVFESYCTERAKEINHERSLSEKKDPRVSFLELLKAHVKFGQYFVDFKRKHKKDSAYKGFGNSDNEREKLFRSFQELNKLPDREKEQNLLGLLRSGKVEIESDIRYHVLGTQRVAVLLDLHRANQP